MAALAAIAPFISAGASLAGGAVGFLQANYQAQVANNNAQIAQMNANRALEQGGVDAQDSDLRNKTLLATQETQQAASGVSLAGESAIKTRNSARAIGSRDTQAVYSAGLVKNADYNVQKDNFKADASAAGISGISSIIGGIGGAAGSLARTSFGTSLISGASPTANIGKYVPVPKPTVLSTYLNPLLRQSHAAQAGF